jgi:hypothetical protein
VNAPRCDRSWEADAHREGQLGPKDVESFERHCRACAVCAEGLARDERLRTLGRALPVVVPPELALKRVRARILRDVTTKVPSPNWLSPGRMAIALSVGLVLTIAGILIERRASQARDVPANAVVLPSAPPMAGSISPAPGAVWTQTREGAVERVDLETGTLRLHVRPQGPGEQFFVQLPDGEIEVRGTTFYVTALDGSTRHVGVDDGTVVLRLRGSPDVSIGPGASWAASPSSATDEGTPAGVASCAVATTPPRRRADVGPSVREVPDEDDGASIYVDAMQSFREGLYDRAAAAFHAFTLVHPKATEAEDASFLEAVSLAKAGRWDAAALAAERHLETFPRSFRGKEASILVARAATRRGRCDEALKALAPWMTARPDAEIESEIRLCIDGGPPPR